MTISKSTTDVTVILIIVSIREHTILCLESLHFEAGVSALQRQAEQLSASGRHEATHTTPFELLQSAA